MGKRLTIEEIKERMNVINRNIEILSIEHSYKSLKINCKCLIDNHEWSADWSNLSKNKGCPKCAGKVFPTLIEIQEKLKNITDKIEIYEIYIKKHKDNSNEIRCKCRCLIDGYEWESSWSHISRGTGCRRCGNLKTRLINSKTDGNSIRDMRPDLIKYLVNETDADSCAYKGKKTIDVICEHCKSIRKMMVFDLCSRGFSCKICSDGISIPEKFGINLFKQLGVKFEPQKTFTWSERKRYDFYLTESTIIEVHGRQHYEDIFSKMSRAKNTVDEKINDELKYNLAITNGIKSENYIIVDCRNSEFEWLKYNYIKSLSPYFDLSNINWDLIWLNSQKSIKKEVWEAWNNRDIYTETAKTISKKFNISQGTVRNYLKTGTTLQMCNYDSQDEIAKARNKRKKVI